MNPFGTTHYVTLEISNMCNYAPIHKACPAADVKTPVTLPSSIVYDVLRTLGEYGYGRGQTISFYVHNEPLNDPRLFMFVAEARQQCPEASIVIGSNGWYLTTVLALELYTVGASYILATAYTEKEHMRLNQVRRELEDLHRRGEIDICAPDPPAFGVRQIEKFDDRRSMNNRDEGGRPCYAPLTELIVTADGRMGLCCLDVWHHNAFGDLHSEKFIDVVMEYHPALAGVRADLDMGVRKLDVCQKCSYVNRWRWIKRTGGDNRWEKDVLGVPCESGVAACACVGERG